MQQAPRAFPLRVCLVAAWPLVHLGAVSGRHAKTSLSLSLARYFFGPVPWLLSCLSLSLSLRVSECRFVSQEPLLPSVVVGGVVVRGSRGLVRRLLLAAGATANIRPPSSSNLRAR